MTERSERNVLKMDVDVGIDADILVSADRKRRDVAKDHLTFS